MHGTRRWISGNDIRRAERPRASAERSRARARGGDRGHVRERVIHSRRAGSGRPWGAEGLRRAVQEIRSPALAGAGATYRRPLSPWPSRQRLHGASTPDLQRQDSRPAVDEVRKWQRINLIIISNTSYSSQKGSTLRIFISISMDPPLKSVLIIKEFRSIIFTHFS